MTIAGTSATAPAPGDAAGHPTAADWAELADRHWDRTPVVLRPGPRPRLPEPETARRGGEHHAAAAQPPVLDPEHAYAAIRTACEPFRSGTRARALPDVRFCAPGGRLRAPADRLPGPDDPALAPYVDRMESRPDLPGWLLTVDQPLVVDFALWARVRDLLSALWREVGWPVVPLASDLTLSRNAVKPAEMGLSSVCSGLLWVLSGSVTVRLWRAVDGRAPRTGPPDLELHGAAGEVLYWPAGFHSQEEYGPSTAMTLRIGVRAERRAAAALVKNLLVSAAQTAEIYREGTVPYVPLPPPRRPDGSLGGAPPVEGTGALITEIADGPTLVRTLRAQWAARRSAAGLEPAPAPRPAGGSLDSSRIRVTSEIVRIADGPGRSFWAVNGQVLPVAGSVGDAIRAALPLGREVSVAEVHRAVGVAEDHPAVGALLDRLYRLRAVEAVEDVRGAGDVKDLGDTKDLGDVKDLGHTAGSTGAGPTGRIDGRPAGSGGANGTRHGVEAEDGR